MEAELEVSGRLAYVFARAHDLIAVRGLEEDLLERAGQVAAPHQGRRGVQRMAFQADPDHVVRAYRPRQPDQPRPGPGDGSGAGSILCV